MKEKALDICSSNFASSENQVKMFNIFSNENKIMRFNNRNFNPYPMLLH